MNKKKASLSSYQRIPGAVSVFRWTVFHLYYKKEFMESIPDLERDTLWACYQQATRGPLSSDIKEPSWMNKQANALFTTPFDTLYQLNNMVNPFAVTGPIENKELDINSMVPLQDISKLSKNEWAAWKDLGDMNKEEAVDLFLEIMSKINEDFLDEKVDPITDEACGPAMAASEYTDGRFLSIREIIIRNGTVRIQALARGIIYKARYLKYKAKKNANLIDDIHSVLTQGMDVYKMPVEDSVGDGLLRKRKLILRQGATLAKSYLCLVNSNNLGITSYDPNRNIYISDIADVRCGISSYNFKRNPVAKKYPEDCISIIGSKRTFDLIISPSKGREWRLWFVKCMYYLIDSSLSPEELHGRNRVPYAKLRPNPIYIPPGFKQDGLRLAALLETSFGIDEVMNGSHSVTKSLWVQWDQRRLYVGTRTTAGAKDAKGLDIDDICEIRHGFTTGVLDDKTTFLNDRTFTIIGSEGILTLCVQNKAMRNKVCRNFRAFLAMLQTAGKSPDLHGPTAHKLTIP